MSELSKMLRKWLDKKMYQMVLDYMAQADESQVDDDSLIIQAQAYIELGDSPRAIEILDGLCQQGRSLIKVHFYLGLAYSQMGEHRLSIQHYEQSNSLDEGNDYTEHNLRAIYRDYSLRLRSEELWQWLRTTPAQSLMSTLPDYLKGLLPEAEMTIDGGRLRMLLHPERQYMQYIYEYLLRAMPEELRAQWSPSIERTAPASQYDELEVMQTYKRSATLENSDREEIGTGRTLWKRYIKAFYQEDHSLYMGLNRHGLEPCYLAIVVEPESGASRKAFTKLYERILNEYIQPLTEQEHPVVKLFGSASSLSGEAYVGLIDLLCYDYTRLISRLASDRRFISMIEESGLVPAIHLCSFARIGSDDDRGVNISDLHLPPMADIISLLEAIPEESRSPEEELALVRALVSEGQWERALGLMLANGERVANDPLWLYQIGNAYMAMEEYGEAAHYYACSAELEKNQPLIPHSAATKASYLAGGLSDAYYSHDDIDMVAGMLSFIEMQFGYIGGIEREASDSAEQIVDIVVIPPSEARPYIRLVTLGMSAYEMSIPKEIEVERLERAELTLCLDPSWQLDTDEGRWPIDLLREMAHLPREQQVWLGYGHTIDNEEAYAPTTRLSASVLDLPMLDGERMQEVYYVDEDTEVNYYQMLLLYPEELNYSYQASSAALIELLDSTADITRLDRPSAVTSKPAILSPKSSKGRKD